MLDNEDAVASFRLRPARSTRSSQQLRFEKDFKVKEVEDNKEAKDARMPRCAKEIPKYREETTSLQADQVDLCVCCHVHGGRTFREALVAPSGRGQCNLCKSRTTSTLPAKVHAHV